MPGIKSRDDEVIDNKREHGHCMSDNIRKMVLRHFAHVIICVFVLFEYKQKGFLSLQ